MSDAIGIFDLGSNSVRMTVVRLFPNGGYRKLTEVKAVLRLASAIGDEGAISEEGLQRTIATVQDFMRLARSYQVGTYLAVATAAVRQATNGAQFAHSLSHATGVEFRIISGQEEAELGFCGALNTLGETDGLLVDIGGASTELVRFAGRRIIAATSLPYGAVTLTETFLPKGSGSQKAYGALTKFFGELLSTVPWLHTARGLPLIGVGGTIRSLARIDLKSRKYPVEVLHNYQMAPAAMEQAYDLVRRTPVRNRSKIPGLSGGRSDIIAAGAAAAWQVMSRSGARELVASGSGVREGLLYRHLLGSSQPVLVPDVLAHSITNLLRTYDLDEPRSRESSRLALALFDQLKPLHGLDDRMRSCLQAGAALTELGSVINVYGQDQHTFYLITRGRLYGLTHREVVIAGAAAAFKGAGKAKSLSEAYGMILQSGDEDVIRRLGVLTAIARDLTRYGPGIVSELAATWDRSRVTLLLHTAASLPDDVRELTAWAPDFRKAFGVELQVDVA